ncbi:MAG: hypothetical protein U0T84_13945 [Chitinophagales bacterium]
MKNWFLTVLLAGSWALYAQKNVAIAERLSAPIQVDGKAREWPEQFRYFDGNAHLQYALRYDSAALYFCFQSNDQQAQLKILRAGIQLTFDVKEKKSHTASLLYPYFSNRQEERNRTTLNEMRSGFVQTTLKPEFYQKGFMGLQEGAYVSDTSFAAAYGWDSLHNLNLEFKIPFSRLGATIQSIRCAVTVLPPEQMPQLGDNGGTGENAFDRHRGGMNPYQNGANGLNNGLNNGYPGSVNNTNGYNPTAADDQNGNATAPARTAMMEANRFSFVISFGK